MINLILGLTMIDDSGTAPARPSGSNRAGGPRAERPAQKAQELGEWRMERHEGELASW